MSSEQMLLRSSPSIAFDSVLRLWCELAPKLDMNVIPREFFAGTGATAQVRVCECRVLLDQTGLTMH